MRAPIPAALFACALALGVAASRADAQPHTTGAPDRYGYAPPDAQVTMARLRGRETAAAPAFSAAASPTLRLLSWPGKATPALRADAAPAEPAPASAPVLRPARAAAAVRRAPVRVASAPPAPVWTPRRRAPAQASASAPIGYAPARRFTVPVPSAPPQGYATAAISAPGMTPSVPAAAPAGVGVLPPPVRPWYQRWPEAASPGPSAFSGVGPSLAPAPPAAPPPAAAAPVAVFSAPRPAAAPAVRTAALAPAGGTARYYSLHKPYGHGPDPAPIPPQFFGPTADLSAPETPEPARATLTASASSARAAVNAARLQQGAAD